MAANFCVYYAIWAMLGTYLQKELGWTPAQVAVPVFWGNIITFVASSLLGGGVGKGRAPLGADDPHLHLHLHRAALSFDDRSDACS